MGSKHPLSHIHIVYITYNPCIYHTVTPFEYVEGGPDREAPGVA